MATRSLGQLTIDLIARTGGFVGGMSKAERESAKWRKQVEKDAKVVGTAIGAASAAALTGLAALTLSTVKAAGEISRFSAISGAGVEEFQRYAVAAEVVGINQEKLGDIFKDTNDKVGDFLATGGGELKDFFEQIAPQVGVTAEQFRSLSGPQALQLFANSLEKANLSQAEMTFYMEGIADEASALIPLLKDNGAGFKLLGDAASAAGAVMDQETIRAANELSASVMLSKMALEGASNQIVGGMLPSLSDLAEVLVDVSTEGEVFAGIGESVAAVLKFIAARGVDTWAAFQILGKSIAGVAFIASEVPNGMDAVSNAISIVGDSIEETTSKAAELVAKIESAGEGGTTNAKVSAIADILSETTRATTGASAQIGEAAQKAADAIQKQVDALRLQADTVGMAADQAELYKLKLDGATESQLRQAEAALQSVAAYEKQAEAVRKMNEAQEETNREAISIMDSLLSEEEQIKQSYERRRQIIMDATLLTAEERNQALMQLEEEHNEQMLEVNGSYWERYLAAAEENLQSFDELSGVMLENFTGRFGDAFESMVFDAQSLGDAVSGLAEGMVRSIVNALGQMAAQWVAYHAVQLMLGKNSEATAIASAAITGTSIAAAYAPAAAMASLASFGANSAPAMAGITSTVGLSQTMALAGMAHDGIDSIPETGTWLLEKGERVTTAETSKKLDKTLDQIKGGGSSPQIIIQAPVTVEAQPGASAEEAQAYGREVAGAMTATTLKTIEQESRPGGLLWNLYGGGR